MKLKERVAVAKWHVCVGYSVLGMFGLGVVVAKAVRDILDERGHHVPLWVLYPAGVLALYVVGKCYDLFGFYSAESSYSYERTKYFEEHVKKKGGANGDSEKE